MRVKNLAGRLTCVDGDRDRPAGAQDLTGAGENEHGRLLGHLALANPQWRSVGPQTVALAIVHGPQAYISPSWYPSTARHGKVVPTWNYVDVHAYGRLQLVEDDDCLGRLLRRLSDRHEAGNPAPWRMQDLPEAYLAGMLKGIIGLDITVTRLEGKFKLSQNRPAVDRPRVIAALERCSDDDARGVAALMREREPA